MKICIFGDSIGKGVILPDTGHYKMVKPDLEKLTGRKDLELKNYAVFGSTITRTLQVLERHAGELTDGETVLLEVGGNDCDFDWQAISDKPEEKHECKTPFSVFEDAYRRVINLIRGKNATPVILTMPPMIPKRYFDTIAIGKNRENILRWLGGTVETMYRWQEMYNLRLVMLARSLNVRLIDIRSVFLADHHCENLISRDGIHPNEKGYNLIYQSVKDSMS